MSELTELKKRIDLEIAAMQRGFNGYAAVAKHRKVEQTYDSIGFFLSKLTSVVGYEQAMLIAMEELERD